MFRILCIVSLATALLSEGIPLEGSRYESLQGNSPFIPPGFVPPEDRRPQRPTRPEPRREDPLDRIEFRSMTIWQGTPSFSLHNPSENTSYWLEEGESEDGYRVVSFDPSSEEITVSREGRTRRIALRESRVTTQENSEESVTQRQTTSQAPTPSMTPEEREERLRQRAEELRERQAVRRRVITPSREEE
ncbi:MAG: hypothetical protein LAT55_11610 [Opitutales bacterium]|nr:hypothetical protein [Opitutales bacterium]